MKTVDLLALLRYGDDPVDRGKALRQLPRAAHDGEGCTPANSFAALVGKPGETVVPADYVFTWVDIAGYLGVCRQTVWRQTHTGSLSWVPKVNGLPTAHVESLAAHLGVLGEALAETRNNLKRGTLFPVTGELKGAKDK